MEDEVLKKAKLVVQLLRPDQYMKNLFIFAPYFFSFKFSLDKLAGEAIVFCMFSALASGVYIFNDLTDIAEDRKHPVKKNRPIASGEIKKGTAIFLMVNLSLISLVSSFAFNKGLFYVMVFYLSINLLYSLILKHIPIIDIFTIATGFVLRLFAGNSILNSELSMWIVIMTFLLALFLAIAKRRDDVLLLSQGKKTRKNIEGYNLEFINTTMTLMGGVIIVAYILYTVSDQVINRLHTHYLYLTSFFVILGIIRYMQITFVEQWSGSPTKVVLKDRFLQITIICWLISFFIIAKGGLIING